MPYQRKGSKHWQIIVSGVRQSSGTTDYHRAKTLEHKLNHEAWDAKRLGVRFSTWEQTCLDWFKRKAALKSLGVYAHYAKFWNRQFKGKQLKNVNGELARQILINEGRVSLELAIPANTTANLKLAFVGRIVKHGGLAFRADYFPAPKGREEWLTLEQWRSLEMADDLKRLATFSLATGLRAGNVMGLQWSWVKGNAVLIPSEFAKTARPYGIPLNKTALGVLEACEGDVGSVFTLSGKPIYPMLLQRAWSACLRRSGVPHMPYHGLRHTYASWMVQAGVPFEIVARLGQWKSKGMIHRYSHFDVESLRAWAERFDDILATRTHKYRTPTALEA